MIFINIKSKVKYYIIWIGVSLGVGALAAFITRNNMNIYESVNAPSLAPPAILFPIVWSVLYILMGISAAMIYTDTSSSLEKREKALSVYVISLFFNFFWSIIFFNLQNFIFAFVWLVILWALVFLTIALYFKIKKITAYLQIPYLIWVTFAGYLNLSIALLNQ